MISGGIAVNQLAQIRFIWKAKFGDNPCYLYSKNAIDQILLNYPSILESIPIS